MSLLEAERVQARYDRGAVRVQVVRAILWTAIAVPVIRTMKGW